MPNIDFNDLSEFEDDSLKNMIAIIQDELESRKDERKAQLIYNVRQAMSQLLEEYSDTDFCVEYNNPFSANIIINLKNVDWNTITDKPKS
jgi:hypothetical protein